MSSQRVSGQSPQFFIAQYKWTLMLFPRKSPKMYNMNKVNVTHVYQLALETMSHLCPLHDLLWAWWGPLLHPYNKKFDIHIQYQTSYSQYHAMYQRSSVASSLVWQLHIMCQLDNVQPRNVLLALVVQLTWTYLVPLLTVFVHSSSRVWATRSPREIVHIPMILVLYVHT
jgi:hypothetical protein